MKKIKSIIIIAILLGIVFYYRDNISNFIENLPFFSSTEAEPEIITDKGSYEYYFEPFITEKG